MFDLKFHEVEIGLWCEVLRVLLSENYVAAEWRLVQAVIESRDSDYDLNKIKIWSCMVDTLVM